MDPMCEQASREPAVPRAVMHDPVATVAPEAPATNGVSLPVIRPEGVRDGVVNSLNPSADAVTVGRGEGTAMRGSRLASTGYSCDDERLGGTIGPPGRPGFQQREPDCHGDVRAGTRGAKVEFAYWRGAGSSPVGRRERLVVADGTWG